MWVIEEDDRKSPVKVEYEGKPLDFFPFSDDLIDVDCNEPNEFFDLVGSNFPSNIRIGIKTKNLKHDSICWFVYVYKVNNEKYVQLICELSKEYWKSQWNTSLVIKTMAENSLYCDLKVEETEYTSSEEPSIVYSRKLSSNITIEDQIKLSLEDANSTAHYAESLLGKPIWDKEYEINELAFSEKIIFPLLRKMGYIDIRKNHGQKEFGKDFTFSEISPLNVTIHHAIQTKAGNISGRVNSQIDEIINQLEDSFMIPYRIPGSEEDRYISCFYVVISGLFTENAKEKIIHKISKNLKGSVYFLDKFKVLELIEKYF